MNWTWDGMSSVPHEQLFAKNNSASHFHTGQHNSACQFGYVPNNFSWSIVCHLAISQFGGRSAVKTKSGTLLSSPQSQLGRNLHLLYQRCKPAPQVFRIVGQLGQKKEAERSSRTGIASTPQLEQGDRQWRRDPGQITAVVNPSRFKVSSGWKPKLNWCF